MFEGKVLSINPSRLFSHSLSRGVPSQHNKAESDDENDDDFDYANSVFVPDDAREYYAAGILVAWSARLAILRWKPTTNVVSFPIPIPEIRSCVLLLSRRPIHTYHGCSQWTCFWRRLYAGRGRLLTA